MRITESGLRRVIKRIIAEQAAMEDPYQILANGLLNNDPKEINLGVQFLNRSLKPTDTNDMIVQRLKQYGVDRMTASSFVDKTFPEETSVGIGGASNPYKEFYQAMYQDMGDERAAAQKIRKLVGSTSPDAFQEIMDGLMAAAPQIDPDDAEAFADEILSGKY